MTQELPPQVMTFARSALDDASLNPDVCPAPSSVFGWWVQAHNQGCETEHGYALDDIYEAYRNDGASHLLGEPSEGSFVSMTPIETVSLGESRQSLGQVVKKDRVPLEEGERIVEKILKQITPFSKAAIPVGSVARKRIEIADIDFVVLPKNLKKFDEEIREIGFSGGKDMRIYKKVVDGIKVELYIAHEPKEMGSMIFMWLGDKILNIAQRSKAKKMGLKLNQYGLWKGDKLVFQSADERDFWDYLGMDYHMPEQRSIARRHDLQDMIRDLKDEKLTDKERSFVEEAGKILRKEKYIEPTQEKDLEDLFLAYFPKKKEKAEKHAMAGATMGAEELIEMGADLPEDEKSLRERWEDGEIEVVYQFDPDHSAVGILDKASGLILADWQDEEVYDRIKAGIFTDPSSSLGDPVDRFEESVIAHAEREGVSAYPRE